MPSTNVSPLTLLYERFSDSKSTSLPNNSGLLQPLLQ